MADPYTYKVQAEYDKTIDELGNTAIIMRKIAWGESKNYKLEIRKWHLKGDVETPGKGVTFLTPEGPANLAKAIIDSGYGNTETYLESLSQREDFNTALVNVIGKEAVGIAKESEKEIYYDPREVIK